MCAKLHTVAASNNRDHMPWSLYYCLFALHIIMVLFFTHIPFVVNHTFNATPPERLQQYERSTSVMSNRIVPQLSVEISIYICQIIRTKFVLLQSNCFNIWSVESRIKYRISVASIPDWDSYFSRMRLRASRQIMLNSIRNILLEEHYLK